MSWLQQFWQDILNTSPLEWMGVVCGIAYVILIAKKKLAGWIFAIIGSSIYIYLCFIGNYYLETILQVFYLIMGFWGLFSWMKLKNGKEKLLNVNEELNFIQKWPILYHVINLAGSTLLMFILGYYFQNYTNQARPYLDAFTTVFSLAATFMVTQRVLENWIYWIVIDLFSIELYAYRGYALTAVLMGLYTILAIYGYLEWRKQYKASISMK